MQKNHFRRFGTMVDCSRGAVMTVEALKRWIDLTSDLGYNTLMIYTEDTYEIEGQPYFGYLRGRYTTEELRQIDQYAREKNMELIPCIQTLAHLEAIFRWNTYRKIQDCNDILLADDEMTYELIDAMFRSVQKSFTCKTVNIGMDEAHMLGRGRYQDLNGSKDRFDILLKHLNRVAEIAKKYDFQLLMWGDMFFRLLTGGGYGENVAEVPQKVRDLIPDNVNLIYWDYYSCEQERYDKNIKAHSAAKENIWFAGGLWTWAGFAPHNMFSINATEAALKACIENGVQDVFLTMWGDDGAECSKFSLLPSLYYASQLEKGIFDPDEIKLNFQNKYGIAFDDFMLLDLPDTPTFGDTEIFNPETYMLYSDLFLGVLDATVLPGDGEKYAACAKKLSGIQNPEYQYLFDTLESLCKVLSLKAELGVKTRKAYQSDDRAKLSAILKDYAQLKDLVEAFYADFRRQWLLENKPQGFEMHDIRIGGILQRLQYCQDRIEAYLQNRIDRIEELEETILPAFGGGRPVQFKSWKLNAMVDTM